MRPEHVRDLTKILFLDIETVPQSHQWDQLDERTAQLFSDKTRYDQERQGKTAEEIYGEKGGILAETCSRAQSLQTNCEASSRGGIRLFRYHSGPDWPKVDSSNATFPSLLDLSPNGAGGPCRAVAF